MAPSGSPNRRRLARAAGLAAGILLATASASAADGRSCARTRPTPSPTTTSSSSTTTSWPRAAGRSIDSLGREHQATIKYRYLNAVQGFAAEDEPGAGAASCPRTRRSPTSSRTGKVQALGTQSPTPSWGLDRIDQRDLPLNNSYTYPNTARA